MPTSRRLLVLGGSGTLGGPLCARAAAGGWDVTATYLTRPDAIRAGRAARLDLRDGAALRVLVDQVRPHAIIHAAVTERSGPGYPDAIRLAAQHTAEVAAERQIRLITLSTDLVFDGTRQRYDEASEVCPLSEYGAAKADAERQTALLYPPALIVRTSLIYDFDARNPQVAWMLRVLAQGETLRLFADQWRCPIWVWTLADALLELVETDAAGLLHVVGPALISRHALGLGLLAALGIETAGRVEAAPAPEAQPKRLDLSLDRARGLLRHTPLLTLDEAYAVWERA